MPLVCEGLGFRYPGTAPDAPDALSEVFFALEPGELVGIAGCSGSGKTTLARCLAGQLKPCAGTVEADGVDSADDGAGSRRGYASHVGLVMQLPERQLFAKTVYDDVAFGPRNMGLDEAAVDTRVRQSLAIVGFGYKRSLVASPFEISGGEQRRVAIAGVLALRPWYLVLDEPTAGLDPVGRDALMERLRALADAGVGVAMVSHDMELLARFATRVVVLDSGHVVLDRPVREAFSDPDAICAAGLELPVAASVRAKLVSLGMEIPDDAVTDDGLAATLKALGEPVVQVTSEGSTAAAISEPSGASAASAIHAALDTSETPTASGTSTVSATPAVAASSTNGEPQEHDEGGTL